MKLKFVGCLFVVVSMLGCGGGDSSVSTEEGLSNKPTIYGLGINITDIPDQHAIQPKLFNEFGLPVNGNEGGRKNLTHPEFFMPKGAVVTAV